MYRASLSTQRGSLSGGGLGLLDITGFTMADDKTFSNYDCDVRSLRYSLVYR